MIRNCYFHCFTDTTCVLKIENMIFSLIFPPYYMVYYCAKGVVSFYLKLKNEFQAFPTKNLASNWLTCWLGQPIRGLVFGDKWLEFISQSQIKKETTYNFSNYNLLNYKKKFFYIPPSNESPKLLLSKSM